MRGERDLREEGALETLKALGPLDLELRVPADVVERYLELEWELVLAGAYQVGIPLFEEARVRE